MAHGEYADVYLKGYASMGELLLGLTQYFEFYNGERRHQALNNRTPEAVYRSGSGGGALIIDKYPPQSLCPEESCAPRRTQALRRTPRDQINDQGSTVQLHLTLNAQLKLTSKLS